MDFRSFLKIFHFACHVRNRVQSIVSLSNGMLGCLFACLGYQQVIPGSVALRRGPCRPKKSFCVP